MHKHTVTPQQFARLLAALPEDLRDPVAFIYRSHWRVAEVCILQWGDIDVERCTVRLRSSNGPPCAR